MLKGIAIPVSHTNGNFPAWKTMERRASASQWHPLDKARVTVLRQKGHRVCVAQGPACSGNSPSSPSRVAGQTPRSVIRPVTSRAGVTSKP